MRRAPWWESEGGSHRSTFQDDWHAHLQEYGSDSESDCVDPEMSTIITETDGPTVYACEDSLDTFEGDDYLPELQSVSDSDVDSECFDDFDSPDFDDFAGMPDLVIMSDSEDGEEPSTPGDASHSINESIDSLEGESRPSKQNQSMPFLRRGFLLSAVQKTNRSAQSVGPDIHALEQNVVCVKGADRICLKPIVVVVSINGQSCRALIDSGSFSDFMSTTLADQLKVKLEVLDKPLPLQLAVSGSRGKVKVRTTMQFEYQNIKENRAFDIINVDSYDLILGTPFLFQHQVLLGFNPSQVNVRSTESLPIRGTQVLVLESRATEISASYIDSLREELTEYALSICKEAIETPLPPLRVINHVIPLNYEHKVYSWRPSQCPEQLKPLW
jgi:Retroviral aspartyl protease